MSMARRPRIYYPGALYQVIARGNQKQGVSLDEIDFRASFSYLSEYKSKYSFILFACALMKNRIHLWVEVKETSLSKIMQVLQSRYTRYLMGDTDVANDKFGYSVTQQQY